MRRDAGRHSNDVIVDRAENALLKAALVVGRCPAIESLDVFVGRSEARHRSSLRTFSAWPGSRFSRITLMDMRRLGSAVVAFGLLLSFALALQHRSDRHELPSRSDGAVLVGRVLGPNADVLEVRNQEFRRATPLALTLLSVSVAAAVGLGFRRRSRLALRRRVDYLRRIALTGRGSRAPPSNLA